MPLKAVVFDAFGTLVYIQDRRSPFRRLIRWSEEHGRARQVEDGERIMSTALDLRGAAAALGLTPPEELLAQWERDLQHELTAIRVYPEARDLIVELQKAGYRVALCSNLAAPYGPPVRTLLPTLDAYAMSYEVGAVKPQPRIYQFLLDHLGLAAGEVLFIGDTAIADQDGPRAVGMQACLLDRSTGQSLSAVVQSTLSLSDER